MLGISILSVIILLGVLIFAHELGHFLMAKQAGVGVERFQLGFGPKILGKTWGETEYRLSLIPLGGLVKLVGESDVDSLSEEESKRSFLRQPVGKKILIVLAGPVFNLLLAILIFTVIYMLGIPALTTQIGTVQPSSAAAEAGILTGDVILSISGQKITYWDELAEVISDSEGTALNIIVERGGESLSFILRARLTKTKNLFGEEVSAYKIGVSPASNTVVRRMNPLRAFWNSLKQTWLITKLTLVSIVKIFEGVLSPRTLGGPILIAQIAGAQVKEGIIPFALFMALLSINLAVLNLLPIPVLDGGHLMFYLIEMATGKEINLKWREMAQQIGFVLLIALMIFVIMMDIERLNIKAIDDLSKMFTR
ncbi:MAG: RIP metalloprotease RseP [Deltaproteobacteria bacterium]|nr:RIP metalloprotease RseP [Deltaproteobacteria bacterium]